jgi:hypothetical protein
VVPQSFDIALTPATIANGPAGRHYIVEQGGIVDELAGPEMLYELPAGHRAIAMLDEICEQA